MGFFDSWKCNVKTFVKNPILYPGNIIEGYVEITAKSEIEFVAVRLKLTGKEMTCITRRHHDHHQNGQVNYDEPERFMQRNTVYKQLVTLAGEMKWGGYRTSQKMPAGTWTYPFAFQLPMDLPPSFDHHSGGDFADCAYYIKAYIDIPGGRDASHKTHFTVLRPMPLSQWGHAAPVSVDRSFDVTCCCCISKGSVNARLYMDRTLISMDRDNLTVYVDVDNTNGKEPVEGVEFSLNNIVTYNAMHLTETDRNRVGHKHIKQRIEPGAKGIIQGVVEIPRDIIPTCRTWNVNSEHNITLELNIPWASDPCHTFPVIVAQGVDETNFSPPIVFSNCSYQALPKGQYPEFVYVPPPQPVFAHSPIPSIYAPSGQSAPPIDYGYAQQEQFRPLPPTAAGWKHPSVYNDGRETYNAQVAWQPGVPQMYQAQNPMSAPPAAAQPAASSDPHATVV